MPRRRIPDDERKVQVTVNVHPRMLKWVQTKGKRVGKWENDSQAFRFVMREYMKRKGENVEGL